jgi:protoheme IX farnesyltransferase
MKSQLQSYLGLCKLKVVALIVFTAMVGMFMATSPPGVVPWEVLLFGNLGIGMAASAAAAINHVLDAREDAKMTRTHNRPLPQGEIKGRNALIFALLLGSLSMLILVVFINTLTAVLTFLSLVGYAVVYTMYLKRATPQNIVIGGAAGAFPPLIGWAAVTGGLELMPILLFLVVFFWTPPHFWALALYRQKDYAEVGVPMLPVTAGAEATRRQILAYSVVLFVVSLLPAVIGTSGWLYAALTLGLSGSFLWYAWRLYRQPSDRLAMRLFKFSIVYLFALFSAILADHWFLVWWTA